MGVRTYIHVKGTDWVNSKESQWIELINKLIILLNAPQNYIGSIELKSGSKFKRDGFTHSHIIFQ